MQHLEFGLDTFGDVPQDDSGTPVSYARAIRQVVDEAVLADAIGVDVIALGEHHRPEYSISTPETVLAGIAMRTSRIRLASGVTVLSSDDPVRVFQRFATVDALSHGRAEVILGRGSFTESFPLFGYDLRDYDVLFEEKIELFAKLLEEKPVTWSGTVRAPLENADVFPKTEAGHLTTWVGVGGTPESVIRTARYGFPLMLAIIGGAPKRFASYIDLYQRAAAQFGTTAHPVASAHCEAGRRYARRSMRERSSTARSTSARPRRSLARSLAPSRRLASAGSTSSTPREHSRSALECAPLSCMARR